MALISSLFLVESLPLSPRLWTPMPLSSLKQSKLFNSCLCLSLCIYLPGLTIFLSRYVFPVSLSFKHTCLSRVSGIGRVKIVRLIALVSSDWLVRAFLFIILHRKPSDILALHNLCTYSCLEGIQPLFPSVPGSLMVNHYPNQ